jgi:PAS domain S-box-containing protein
MPESDIDQKMAHLEDQSRIMRQVAFASGLFQGDITIRTLLESLAEGVVIIDDAGTILLVNTFAEKMFGYAAKDLIGVPHNTLIPERYQKVHQDHQAHFFAEPKIRPMGQLLALVGRRKDGSEFPLEICLSFIETINGILVMAFISDITERKQFADEVERLNSEMAVRNAELEAANLKLEAFNYAVAHDLRQPLNLLGMYCQSLKMLCGDQLQGKCTDYVEKTYETTLQMNNLIDALLNFSRPGHVDLRLEMVDLSSMAHKVAAMLKQTDPYRQVDFRIADGVVNNADGPLLRVVLDNLLGNAWKFTDMRDLAVIEFGVIEIDGVPTYFVRDNGAGFDMADADKLFIPFKRLPNAKENTGFGIGLATVERIIHHHGGRVWAESEREKGATFYFTLSSD